MLEQRRLFSSSSALPQGSRKFTALTLTPALSRGRGRNAQIRADTPLPQRCFAKEPGVKANTVVPKFVTNVYAALKRVYFQAARNAIHYSQCGF